MKKAMLPKEKRSQAHGKFITLIKRSIQDDFFMELIYTVALTMILWIILEA